MRPLTVFMTNIELTNWRGAQIVLRDFAVALKRRGHRPVVWASYPGYASDQYRKLGIEVVDHPADLAKPPDIIQGQHNLPTAAALASYPGVPAILLCHSTEWADQPLHLDRIWRYVTVDRKRQEFLIKRHGIDPARMAILPNAVDLTRFRPRGTALPARPSRAMAFTKFSGHVGLLKSVCTGRGMVFDSIIGGVGETDPEPEHTLREQHVVFATGRSALEAACAGAAVIAADRRGVAGMVTTRNMRVLRKGNFGSLALIRPVTSEIIAQELDKYDPGDAAEVTRWLREDADLEDATDHIEALYEGALAAGFPQRWTDDDRRGFAALLNAWPAPPDWPEKERDVILAAVARNR